MEQSDDRFQKVVIVERRDCAADLWTMRMRPEERLCFQPGQYATLGLLDDDRMVERPYSIVSSPHEEEVEFFFELVREGGLTPALHKMKAGDSLWMRRRAMGQFTLDSQSGHQQHFFVATVTGIAPFVSMIRRLAQEIREGRPADLKLVVLHSASRSWEFAYCDELARLAREAGWFRYIPTVSRPWEDPGWTGEVGRIEDVLRKYIDSLGLEPSTATAYLCGHPQMIVNARAMLERRGFSKDSIRQELYWMPKKGES